MTQQGQGVAQPPYPREPNVHSGGKQEPGSDRELPPYSGRQKTSSEGAHQAQSSHEAGAREVSQAEKEGYDSTEFDPKDIHGVGDSVSKSGEEFAQEISRDEQHSDRMDTGVSREKNIDPGSPQMHTGDQGD